MIKIALKHLSAHLTSLALIPCALLSLVVIYNLIASYGKLQDANDTEYNAFLSHHALAVVHEVQKERGNTAGFIGSQGQRFGDSLRQQRQKTDQALAALQSAKLAWDLSAEMQRNLDSFLAAFSRLGSIRSQVNNQSLALSDALKFYTNINVQGLKNVVAASRLSRNQVISNKLFAIYNFSYAKESAGIERAVLANVIAADKFTPTLRRRHIELETKQSVYLDEALKIAPAQMRSMFESALSGEEIRKVENYRQAVKDIGDNFGLDPQAWFSAATQRINLLKATEQQALDLVGKTAIQIQQDSERALLLESLILLSGTLVTGILFFALKRRQKQSDLIFAGINVAIKDRDLGDEIPVVTEDELGQTARNINKLTRLFEEDLRDFKRVSKDIISSTDETAISITQSQANLLEQQAGVQSIVTVTEQMNTSTKNIADSMRNNLAVAYDVMTASQDGQKTVEEAVEYINAASNEMSESADSVNNLEEQVGQISNMVEIIEGIAEQTNLLALNAAIEAARAGEQGRGFAVVADEVRSLASRTQECTEQISEWVTTLKNSSKMTSKVITNGKEKAHLAASNAQHIKGALGAIVDQARQVESIAETVSKSTNEQSQAINEVSDRIADIFNKAMENVTGADQIGVAAQQISSASENMDNLIARYKVAMA